MNNYPVFLNIAGKKCLVVGGGSVAERKVNGLLQCGADVHVVSPVLNDGLSELASAGRINHRSGNYSPNDLKDIFLVFSATDNKSTNGSVAGDCAKNGIMVNVVDDPGLCSFYVPSTISRGALQIAVSTGGYSPLLAKIIRQELELQYNDDFELFVSFVGEIRDKALKEVTAPGLRNYILKNLVDHKTIELVKQGYIDQARERVEHVYHSCRR